MTAVSAQQSSPASRLIDGAFLGFFALVIALLLLLALLLGGGPSGPGGSGGAGGGLALSAVPPRYVPWVLAAGSDCPEITPPVIAAQDQVESGWNPDAVSPAGALGIAQFMPGAFAAWGRNDDGTGNVTPANPRDAIMAQGRYDCDLASLMTRLRDRGAVSGGILSLALAAYNAGPGAVENAGGAPADTTAYYQQIESLAATRYSQSASAGAPSASGSQAGQIAVRAAESALGTWYQFGGSCTDPHGANPAGWCDCSSLMQAAWAAAGVALPRTTYQQWRVGSPVASVSQLVPGDLIFIPGSDATAAGPGHVGMYVGNGMLINAPYTGTTVQLAPVSAWASQIVAMRDVG